MTNKIRLQPEDSNASRQAKNVNAGLAAKVAGLSVERLRLLGREIKARKGETLQKENSASVQTTPLIPIRIAQSGFPPLFLVHPVGGGVVAYNDLAKYLRADQSVYALQNLDSGDKSRREPLRVEEMAAHYIGAIKTVQPSGPYYLGGSSMGGAIAFEMAVQLKAQDNEIALVAMLDTPARITAHMEGHAGHSAFAVELLMLASIIAAGQKKELQVSLGDLEKMEEVEQINVVLQKLQQQQIVSAAVSAASFKDALMAFTSNMNAFERYVPRTYDGRIVLLRATELSADMRESAGDIAYDPTFGWQVHCGQPVIVHFVPGDHVQMNLEPAVRIAGAELQRCLDEARES